MNIQARIFFVLLYFIIITKAAFAFHLISPKEGEKVYAGTELEIIVQPEPGEEWQEIIVDLSPLPCKTLNDEFQGTLKIPLNLVGTYNIVILAADKSRQLSMKERTIFITTPPHVILKSLSVYPDRIILYKLKPKHACRDRQRFETHDLIVTGIYSDGVKRKLPSLSVGTTYLSSDEKIATVSPEGTVEARTIGAAIITVRNGRHAAEVHVQVEPCTSLKQ